jgi:hypothetical protein
VIGSRTPPKKRLQPRAGAPMDRGAPNGAMQVSAPGERARIYPCRNRTTPSPLRPSPLGRGCPDCIGTGEGSRGCRIPPLGTRTSRGSPGDLALTRSQW